MKLVKFTLTLQLLDMTILTFQRQMSAAAEVALDLQPNKTLEFLETGTKRTATLLKRNHYVHLFQLNFRKVASFLASGAGLEEILLQNIR